MLKFVSISLCTFFLSFSVMAQPSEKLTIKSATQTHEFRIEIADNDLSREKGLMFRKQLDANAGMLFVFTQPGMRQFWMKNTLIPLDMIFISADGSIAKIHDSAVPKDLTAISSGMPVVAVLELNGGRARKLNIVAGDKVFYSTPTSGLQIPRH